jgi:hypothetical protein
LEKLELLSIFSGFYFGALATVVETSNKDLGYNLETAISLMITIVVALLQFNDFFYYPFIL